MDRGIDERAEKAVRLRQEASRIIGQLSELRAVRSGDLGESYKHERLLLDRLSLVTRMLEDEIFRPSALDGYQDSYSQYAGYFVPNSVDPSGKAIPVMYIVSCGINVCCLIAYGQAYQICYNAAGGNGAVYVDCITTWWRNAPWAIKVVCPVTMAATTAKCLVGLKRFFPGGNL